MAKLPHKTKADLVYEVLRQRILSGELTPGARVQIGKVAEELGVSDIPVREGIKRLELDGLVQFVAYKGAVVTELNREEIEELYHIRAELESLATRRSGGRMTPEEITRLREILAEMEQAEKAGDTDKASRLHHEFHMQIYESQSYKRLVTMITELWDATNWAGKVFAFGQTSAGTAAEHQPIVDALAAGDGETAARIHSVQKRNALACLIDAR